MRTSSSLLLRIILAPTLLPSSVSLTPALV